MLQPYAELHALSAFSFRRSATLPGELVERAAALGYRALAITDECSMAGVVRAHEAAREHGLHLIIGTEIFTDDGLHLVLLAPNQTAYTQICRLITRARRRAGKGGYQVLPEDLESGLDEVFAIWKPATNHGTTENTEKGSNIHSVSPEPVGRGDTPDGQNDPIAPAVGDVAPTYEKVVERNDQTTNQRTNEQTNKRNNETAIRLKRLFGNRLRLGATRLLEAGEQAWFEQFERLGKHHGIPRLACGDVRMHVRSRRALFDVLTALNENKPVGDCGLALAANGERHLRPITSLERLYPARWLAESVCMAEHCTFSLDSLDYRYPKELAPAALTPAQHLRQLTLAGMHKRYGKAVPERVRALVARELKLIEEMGVEAFFLTVDDVVRFARSRGILCQGRGSAANSAVCYCLGITEVDPAKQQLLFERFISRERDEPPDIDVDFEHERREEVLQYIYEKYGRERAALAATVISYRPRSALRDVGRALGLDPLRVDRLTASLAWWDRPDVWPERLRECGFDPEAPLTRQLIGLTRELIGFPRHLSQHVGGMVIADQPLHHLVPVENAAMAERTIIQWDKDDLETLGLLKVDCLSLGMLTVIRKAMELVGTCYCRSRRQPVDHTALIDQGELETSSVGDVTPTYTPPADQATKRQNDKTTIQPANQPTKERKNEPTNQPLNLATIPREDPATYDMLCRGDAVGVFQVESRAQMAMLPRLKPRCFYDLVIEVAIVRPGPIQGDMVHPYLERRDNPEKVAYPSPELESVLKRTLGVPIFQEQVMQIAIAAAGFTPGEADQLRRAMAAWKRRGGLEPFHEKLVNGMCERGYGAEFAERLYRQICGFGEYGFPESHAASFALLTWFSAWLKCHHPAAFACALLNSQPMGFYAPAQIINDAKRHGVRVLPVDVRVSEWDCTLAPADGYDRRGRGPDLPHAHRSELEKERVQEVGRPDVADGQSRQTSPQPDIRLGLRMVKGLKVDAAERIVVTRSERAFHDVQDLVERAGLDRGQVQALADAGALKGLAGHRHRARWEALATRQQGDLLKDAAIIEPRRPIRPPRARQDMLDDYASLGLSLDHHPLKLLRAQLGRHVHTAAELPGIANGRIIEAAGLVTHRQRPGTASGVIFLSLEDETGIINAIVWPKLIERYRCEVLEGRILRIRGKLQNAGGTQHLVARHITSQDHLLATLQAGSRDFC